MKKGLYMPHKAKVVELVQETPDIMTIKLDGKISFKPGQFLLLSIFGFGESAFAYSGRGFECSVKMCGCTTQAVHRLLPNDIVGVRGPYGNSFLDFYGEKKDVYLVAGGIGTAPIRSLLHYIVDNRSKFGKVVLVIGANTPEKIPFREELASLSKDKKAKIDIVLTIDSPAEGWDGEVGFVPAVLEKLKPKSSGSMAFVCGPPVMMQTCGDVLIKSGFSGKQIISTLENRMQCGVGKCGRCNIGHKYVCKHGPVFTYEEILAMPKDY
jgi:sulfhydrogenase subunit gamma (sulfur reductase)